MEDPPPADNNAEAPQNGEELFDEAVEVLAPAVEETPAVEVPVAEEPVVETAEKSNVPAASESESAPLTTGSSEPASNDVAVSVPDSAPAPKSTFKKIELSPLEIEARESCGSLMFYLFFLFCFFFQSYYSRGDEAAYYMVERVKQDIIENEFLTGANTPNSFMSIANFDDMWRFLEGADSPLRGALLVETGTDGNTFPLLEEHGQYWPQHSNLLLGKIRLRQVRVKADSCDVDEKVSGEGLIEQCYGKFESDIQETASFGPEGDEEKYKYMTDEETGEGDWWGKLGFYPGGGFVEDIDLDEATYYTKLAQLRADDWVMPGITRAVFIDFQMYNPSINVHFSARCAMEMPHTGGIRTKADFFGVKLNAYHGLSGKGQLVCEIFLILFTITFIAMEVRQLRKFGCKTYMKKLNTYINWTNIIFLTGNLLMSAVIASGAFVDWEKPIMNTAPSEETSFIPMVDFMVMIQISNLAASVNALVLWIKLLLYLNVNPRMAVIFETINYAATDLFYFAVLFLVFTIAWGHAGYLAFAADVYTFRSLSQSIINIFLGVFGGLDGEGLETASLYYGPLFEFCFEICMLLILLNVFLAIMNDAYAVVAEKAIKSPDNTKTEAYKSMIKKTWANVWKSQKRNFKKLDTNSDGFADKEEIKAKFISQGKSAEEAEKLANDLLAKRDLDGNGLLSEDEVMDLNYKTMKLQDVNHKLATSDSATELNQMRTLVVDLMKTIKVLQVGIKENRASIKALKGKQGGNLPVLHK